MEDEEFIKQIMERPGIWMSQHPYYKFKRIKAVLWDEVHQLFPHHTIADLRKKWKTFYDIYRRELRRLTSRNDPEARKMPQWRHFELLDGFLRHEVTEARQKVTESITYYEEAEDSDDSNGRNPTETSPPPSPSRGHYSPPATENSPPPSSSSNTGEHSPVSPKATVKSPDSLSITRNSAIRSNITIKSLGSSNATNKSPDAATKSPSIETQNNMRLANGMLLRKLLKRPRSTTRDTKAEQPAASSKTNSGDHTFLMSMLPEIEKLPRYNRIRLRNKFISALLDEIEECEQKTRLTYVVR